MRDLSLQPGSSYLRCRVLEDDLGASGLARAGEGEIEIPLPEYELDLLLVLSRSELFDRARTPID